MCIYFQLKVGVVQNKVNCDIQPKRAVFALQSKNEFP